MMTLQRFQHLIDAYGTERERWPEEARAAMLELLAQSAEAREHVQRAAGLDALLDAVPLTAPADLNADALAARITRLSSRVVTAATGWRMSFGWPSFATLAAAGVFGLMVGWTDLQMAQGNATDVVDLLSPIVVAENPLW